MALLFVDGFDHYVTADIPKKWNSGGANVSIQTAGGRRGGGCMRCTGASPQASKTLQAETSWVVGFAFSCATLTTTAIAQFLDTGTVQCDLRLNADGTLLVTRNGTSVTGGQSTFALSTNTWYFLEIKVSIADSIAANSCKVRVNGGDVITVSAGQDLKNTANTTANSVRLGQSSNTSTFEYDDLYVCNQSGSTNNDFLGDVRVDTLYPTSDGTYTQFTPSTGSTHYLLVDETAPNTSDYVDGNTVGHRDSYGMGNLPALVSQTVYGVQVNAAMLKDDAGAKSAATMVRSGTTNADGTSAALGTSQAYVSQIFEQDPDAAAAWTETTVNAMEAGVVVTA